MRKRLLKYMFLLLILSSMLQLRSLNAVAASETVLNIMDGNITITDKSYVQTKSNGTVVASGDVLNDEIILTGIQNSGFNINVEGSDLPTIHFRNVTTNGYIFGTASSDLNIILEGNCNFTKNIFGSLWSIKQFTISGINGNSAKFTQIDTQDYSQKSKLRSLSFFNINVNGNITINSYGNLNIDNCNFIQGNTNLINNNYDEVNRPSIVVNNSNFDYLIASSRGFMLLDNVTSLSGRIGLGLTLHPELECVIKNSNLKLETLQIYPGTHKIINSCIEFIQKYNTPINFMTASTLLSIEGCTIITPDSNNYDFLTSSNNVISIKDCSLNLKYNGTSMNYKGFYNGTAKSKFDPLDDLSNKLYLNKIKVPYSSNSKVNISIDGRPNVTLVTDQDGYLYLYMPTGQHTVRATDTNGVIYSKTFNGATTNDSDMSDNDAGVLETEIPLIVINTPYINSEIQFSFDRVNWTDAKTNESGDIKISIPDQLTRIFIRLVSTGEIKYAVIKDGTASSFNNAEPLILSQTERSVTFRKGSQGILYVDAIPFDQISTLTYQWEKEGVPINNANRPIFIIPAVKEEDSGNYVCVITELNGSIKKTDSINVTVNNQINDSDIEEQIKDLTEQISGLQNELNTANEDNLSLHNTITGLESEISNLTTNIGTLQDEVTGLEKKIRSEEDENESLNETIIYLNSQIETLKQTVTDREEELEAAISSLKTLEETKSALDNEIQNLNSQVTLLNYMLSESDNKNIQLQEEFESLENNIASLESNIAELQSTLDILNETSLILQDELNTAYSELDNLKIELENEIINLEGELSSANLIIEELRQQVNDLLFENSSLESENEELKEENDRLRNQLEAIMGRNINDDNIDVPADITAVSAVNNADLDTIDSVIIDNAAELMLDLTDYFELKDKTPVHRILIGKNFTAVEEIRNAFEEAVAAKKAAEEIITADEQSEQPIINDIDNDTMDTIPEAVE